MRIAVYSYLYLPLAIGGLGASCVVDTLWSRGHVVEVFTSHRYHLLRGKKVVSLKIAVEGTINVGDCILGYAPTCFLASGVVFSRSPLQSGGAAAVPAPAAPSVL
jgi:hypothetical protein